MKTFDLVDAPHRSGVRFGGRRRTQQSDLQQSNGRAGKPLKDLFKPRTTNGLSSNRNACASYGCVELAAVETSAQGGDR